MKKFFAIILAAVLVLSPFSGVTRTVYAMEKPELVITSYAVDPRMEFNESSYMDVTIKNTSSEYVIRNLVISYTSQNQVLFPAKGASNQKYVESVEPGASITIRFKVMFIESGYLYASGNFTWEYTVEGNFYTGNAAIAVPLSQAGSVNVKNVNVTSTATVGATSLINLNFVNHRKEKIFNTRLVISGVSGGEQVYQIGEVEAGTSRYAETFVTYDSAGTQNVLLTLQYEDSNENEYTEDVGIFVVEVSPRLSNSTPIYSDEAESSGSIMKDILVIVVAAAAIAMVALLFIRNLKKKR